MASWVHVVLVLSCMLAIGHCASWKVASTFHRSYLPGISFTSATQGVVAGFGGIHNGATVFNTTNGASSWSNQTLSRRESLSLTCAAMDASGRGIVAGNGIAIIPGVAYTSDYGTHWNDSLLIHIESRVRDCGLVPGSNGTYAWTIGQWFKVGEIRGQGLGLSVDGGKTFLYWDWNIGLPSRFGSFVNEDYGFVTGGRYPQVIYTNADFTVKVSSDHPMVERLTARFGIYDGELVYASPELEVDHTYVGAIARTDNRGRRFNLMYNSTLYGLNVCFNGVSFVDSYNGWVVAEGYNTTTGKHGGWIFNTNDGGITWTQQLFEEHVSFLRIKMLNTSEGWAIGGQVPSLFLVSGVFYHTTDGGKTWHSESHRDVFPLNLSLIDSDNAYATVLTLRGETQVFKYKS